MVTPLKQQKDDWQTPLPITIGGVSSSASEPYWVGVPGAGGSCKIIYHPPTSTGDDIDETALSYAEIKMLATGNPYIKGLLCYITVNIYLRIFIALTDNSTRTLLQI